MSIHRTLGPAPGDAKAYEALAHMTKAKSQEQEDSRTVGREGRELLGKFMRMEGGFRALFSNRSEFRQLRGRFEKLMEHASPATLATLKARLPDLLAMTRKGDAKGARAEFANLLTDLESRAAQEPPAVKGRIHGLGQRLARELGHHKGSFFSFQGMQHKLSQALEHLSQSELVYVEGKLGALVPPHKHADGSRPTARELADAQSGFHALVDLCSDPAKLRQEIATAVEAAMAQKAQAAQAAPRETVK